MTLRRSLAIGLVIASLAACTPWARIDQGSRSETRRDDFSLDLPLAGSSEPPTARIFLWPATGTR